MLFKIQSGKDVFDLNPELRAIPEFDALTARQMAYVILATDYKSPFRKLAIATRKTRAALEAGYKYEKDGKKLDMNARNVIQGKTPAIERAIRKYNLIQKDEDYETLLGLSRLISDIRELNNTANKSLAELEKAVKLSKELPALMKAKRDLEDIIEMREDEVSEIETAPVAEEASPTALPMLAILNEEDPNND